YLLSKEEQRDGDTWAIHLFDLQARHFDPDATIADGGSGLRAGQQLALPDTDCRFDVFTCSTTSNPWCVTWTTRPTKPSRHAANWSKSRPPSAIAPAAPASVWRRDWSTPSRPRPMPSPWPAMWPC